FQAFKLLFGDDINIYESVFVIYLNQSNQPLGWRKISQGGVSSSIVDVRMVLMPAVHCLASSFIICHNHPSGSMTPSREDRRITDQLKEAGKLLGINILDHVIISENSYYSFADEGLI